MEAYWKPVNDKDCDEFNAKVTICKRMDNVINLVFEGEDDEGDIIQGRFSFDSQKAKQEGKGVWIYPNIMPSDDVRYPASVIGVLTLKDKDLEFVGTWDDKKGSEDGCIYDFEVFATVS